jgi:hypothetical protein
MEDFVSFPAQHSDSFHSRCTHASRYWNLAWIPTPASILELGIQVAYTMSLCANVHEINGYDLVAPTILTLQKL